MRKPPSDYSRTFARKLIRAFLKLVPNATRWAHLHPRAYCVAKPAPYCAVFVVPPRDNEVAVASQASITVHNSSVERVIPGDWCALAYLSTDTSGEQYALRLNDLK